MKIVSPVIPELENYEIKLGENQPGVVEPLPVLRSPEGVAVCRWTFTEEERKAIAAGEDIYVRVLTMNHPIQAMDMRVGLPHESPGNFKRVMRLDDSFELTELARKLTEATKLLEARQLAILTGDEEAKTLALAQQQAVQAFERKKQEVLSPKPSNLIQVVQ